MAATLLHIQKLSRSLTSLPCLARSMSWVRPVIPKPLTPETHRWGAGPNSRPAPEVNTPEAFLKSIGRAADTKVTAGTWEELWKMDGQAMKKAGVGIRDRRYILWCMEKYRLGFPVREFAHEPPPKKTIRGWGPKVQGGKRIRSRRIKDKTRKAKLANSPISA